MINLFHEIRILIHININNDNVKYTFRPDLLGGLHEVCINNKGLTSVQMAKDNYGHKRYYLEYNLGDIGEYLIEPCEQNILDTLFIRKMYSRMIRFYKNNNKKR